MHMPATEDPIPLNYASMKGRTASREARMIVAAEVLTAILGVCLIVIGFLERVYEPLAVGGCILVGSALIAAAITNSRRQ